MAGIIVIAVRGIPQVQAGLTAYQAEIREALVQEVAREGEEIMTESKQLVPVLTGALRASGHVLPVAQTPSGVRLTLAYGNSAVKYAIYVHERVELRHPVGMARFLAVPAEIAAEGMAGRIAAGIRARLAA